MKVPSEPRSPSGEALGRPASWLALGRFVLLWALPTVAGAVALATLLVQRLREARLVALFVVLVAVLWLASVGYTAGGLFYSLRVLSPALALLTVVAGYGLANHVWDIREIKTVVQLLPTQLVFSPLSASVALLLLVQLVGVAVLFSAWVYRREAHRSLHA